MGFFFAGKSFSEGETGSGTETMSEIKETKAQRVERLKRTKNSWEHLEEIREFARGGFATIPPEWLGTYFRPWGIYTQGDGGGVVSGSGGEGRAVPYFMVRIRVPNGLLRSQQAREIAAISREHGNGVLDLTVRQNLQLHWVKIESVPEVLERLQTAGLTTTGACGDVTRNITGCPLAGVHAHEVADTSALVLALDREFAGNAEFYNLPRKFKISVTGCPDWCSYPEINDIGLIAQTRTRNGRRERGFAIRVGGGLSTQPHFSVPLDAFIHPEQVIPVVRAIAEIFRGSDVLRQSREKARLKFLFLEHGWTADSFLAAIEARLGYVLEEGEPPTQPSRVHRDHLGVTPQKQEGLFAIGASVARGRITPQQLELAAGLAERYGDGQVRNTLMQNLLLINVPESSVHHAVRELEAAGLPVGGASAFARGTVACTGSEFCKLALTETKAFAQWLTTQLEERFPNYGEDLRLHITGCPNSCGQHWIADIGIEGKKQKVNGQFVDAYYFCVGGSTGQVASLARPTGYRCAATEVPDAIGRLLESFRANRQSGEPLQNFLARTSTQAIRHILAGGGAEIAERDTEIAATPHSVEDR